MMQRWTKIILISMLSMFTLVAMGQSSRDPAQVRSSKKKTKAKKVQRRAVRPAPVGTVDQEEDQPEAAPVAKARTLPANNELSQALRLAKQGNYQEASQRLFELSYNPRYRDQRQQIKYILGLMLYQMKMYQVAAFQFISVIRAGDSKYLKQSLEKLSLAADSLGDSTLLNYAISRVKVDDFPAVHRDMLYYRIGEFQIANGQLPAGIESLRRVSPSSPLYPKAKYLEAQAKAEANDTKGSVAVFDELIDARGDKNVTDKARVAAMMGKARVFYQAKQWDEAVEIYREIPRDTENWHDTLFESSWAMLRSGKFRSAISNFHSLHSPYYEDFYIPESLLLRGIVYLYICKYDEMEKVLNLYTRVYTPVYRDVKKYLETVRDPVTYFNDVVTVLRDYKKMGEGIDRTKYVLPFLVTRKLIREGDFQQSYSYIRNLLGEQRSWNRMPAKWKASGLGKYSNRVLATRLDKAKIKAGRQIRAHMIEIKDELVDLFEQEGFIRYEMLNSKKESLKKKESGKELPTDAIDESRKRDYYIQNGYEYWPFRGEYWLDELGNYHYLGTQSCG